MSFLLNQEFFLISSYYITGKIIDFFFVPVLGEDGTHLAAQCPVNLAERPRGRDLLETWSRDREVETFWRLGRETERPRPLETWPRDREAETFGGLAERPRPLKT